MRDKVVIVTGASSGIGLATARVFGAKGAKVVMAARRLDLLERLAPSVAPADRGPFRRHRCPGEQCGNIHAGDV